MSHHHYHAVVWIDHHEARVFHLSPTDVERLVLHPDRPTKHIHDPKLMSAIVAVETVDHPSDAQIVAYARKYFDVTDRMQPQRP
jgi:hypothetical protein